MTRWTGIASTRTWPSGSATRTTRFWCSRSFEAARPSRVLDVGFGAGRRVVYLARSGYRVHGIDVSEQGKEYVERLLAAGGLTTEPGGQPGTTIADWRGLRGQHVRRRRVDAKVGQADQDQVRAEAPVESLGAVALAVKRPAGPMVQDRLQRAAVVQLDPRVQAPFVLVGPINGHHMLASSPEGLVAGPASQVGDGEPGGVGHRVTAMPIREGRGPRPPDGRAGPAV